MRVSFVRGASRACEKTYPNIGRWVDEHEGWIEIGYDRLRRKEEGRWKREDVKKRVFQKIFLPSDPERIQAPSFQDGEGLGGVQAPSKHGTFFLLPSSIFLRGDADSPLSSFVRALVRTRAGHDCGGMLWEGKDSYDSLDEALQDLNAGLEAVLKEIYGE